MKTTPAPLPHHRPFTRRLAAAALALLVAGLPAARAALLVHGKYDDSSSANAGTLGAAHDGALSGGAVFTNDFILGNGAVLCDSNALSYISHGAAAVGGNTNRTMSVWTKNNMAVTAPANSQFSLMGMGGTLGAPNGSKFDIDLDATAAPAGVGRIEIGVNGGRTAPTYTAPGINSNQWALVTFTWSASRGTSINGGRVFVNGNFIYAPSQATPVMNTSNGVGSVLNIGKSANTVAPLQYFNGLFDDAAVWNETLSDTDVLGLYQVGVNADLKYDAGQFEQLRGVFLAGSGSATLGARTWVYATNLFSTAGLSNTAAGYVLVLNTTNRTGVAAWSNVPPVIGFSPLSSTNIVGTSVTFSNFAYGAQPITFQWYQSNAPVAGATGQTLTRNPITLAHAGPYYVVASNSFGTSTSAVANLTVIDNTPAFIVTQPTNVTVIKGAPAALSVVADGSPTLAYQWRRGGTPVGGATTNPYNIASTLYTDAGNWDVVVTNNFGSVTSTVAVLTVLDVTPPVIANATNVAVAAAAPAGTAVSLSFVTATDDKDGAVAVSFVPASGSVFPPGVTVVKATATDSSANSATAYFTVSVGNTATTQTNLFDNFEVSGPSNDINFEHDLASRQSGVLAPVPYSELIRNAPFGNLDVGTQVGNASYPGTLYFNPNAAGPSLTEATPAHEFLESPTFAIEVDINPTAGAGSTNWAGLAWGSPFAHVFPDGTGSGMGMLFRGSGQLSVFSGGATLLTNFPASLPTPPFTVRVEVQAAAFDGSPAVVRAFINGTPLALAPGVTNYVKPGGFVNNFIVLSGNAQSGVPEHTFDNFRVTALPSIFASHPDLAVSVGGDSQSFTVAVPPSLVATSAVSVVLSNANPAIAQMSGESGGLRTLNFTSGGTNRQTVTVTGLAAGAATLRLVSASHAVPLGGQPVTVKVSPAAIYLANGSFEAAPVPAFPGYGNIPGWNVSSASWCGVSPNLDAGGVLANNSVSDHGKNVAFLQCVTTVPNAFDQTLSTTVSNLTIGRKYQISFLANNQQNSQANANMTVLLDGAPALFSEVAAVGPSTLGYKPVGLTFTAGAATATLAFSNTTFTSSGLLLDNVEVKPVTPGRWNALTWTDDSDSGIGSTNSYTHAYNLGSATSVVLNGVTFTGVAGANPVVTNQFSIVGAPDVLSGNTQNNLTGSSSNLGSAFIYNGQNPQLTLHGLTPGASYRLSLFGAGFGTTTGTRVASFYGDDGEVLTVDENINGQGNGLRITYDFVATGTGEVISARVLAGGTYHLWAFANQFVAGIPALAITTVAGPQVRVAWPAAVTGYRIQSATALTGPYTDVGTAPTLEGAQQAVYQSPAGTRFYRLISP